MALRHLILSAQYFRALFLCALVSLLVGITHTLFAQTWVYFNGDECWPYGWLSYPRSWITDYYGETLSTDNAAMILVFIVWAILPYQMALNFPPTPPPSTQSTSIAQFCCINRTWLTLILAFLTTAPAWPWCFIRPILIWHTDMINYVYPITWQNFMISGLWRMQELWCLVVMPIIIVPIIYTAFGALAKRTDAFLPENPSIDTTPQQEVKETLASKVSRLIIIITPHWFRGEPASSLYALTLLISLLWWMTYLPEFYPGEAYINSWMEFTQRCKIFIVVLFALGLAMTTTSQRRYTGHIGYIVAIAFLFAAFPFSLSIAIEYWFNVYIDRSQPWLLRVLLLVMFYIISTSMNYMFRMIARNALPISTAAALIFGWTFFEDSIGDLTFLEIGPTSMLFWISAVMLVIKTILRDLDVATDVLYYLQQRYLMSFHTNADGSDVDNNEKRDLLNRYRLWRQQYDRILMRHQNFLAECSSKIAIISSITLETILIGNYHVYNSNIPFVAEHLPLREASERVELLSGLIILWIVQTITHAGILLYLHQVDRRNQAAIKNIQNSESGHDVQLLSSSSSSSSSPRGPTYLQRSSSASAVSIEMQDLTPALLPLPMSDDDFAIYMTQLIHGHWRSSTTCYLWCIITFFYCAVSFVVFSIQQYLVIIPHGKEPC